jgi:hypothetical protein
MALILAQNVERIEQRTGERQFFEIVTFVTSPPSRLWHMLSGELGRLLTVDNIEHPFGTPGKAVARVKASDLKAMWKLGRDSEAQAMAHNPEMKRGQIAIGGGMMQLVCSPDADVNAVWWRGARLGMLMMRCGKRDVQPPDILFTIFAKVPMKWWEVGVPRRSLF